MLNILTRACIAVTYAVAGLFSILHFLVGSPNFFKKIKENRKIDPDDFALLPAFYLSAFLLSAVFCSLFWFRLEKAWALYGLYTLAVLAGTNLISGFYEIGRWKRSKKETMVEAAKEAPVSLDSLGSLLTEVKALPPGISEKKAEELLVKISAAHARGELTSTEFSALTRMVYRRIVSV